LSTAKEQNKKATLFFEKIELNEIVDRALLLADEMEMVDPC
jgi:hypothetical protein